MKQTAVEFLVIQLHGKQQGINNSSYNSIIEQALEMEKQQIQDAYRISPNNELWSNSGIDYYEKTFKNK